MNYDNVIRWLRARPITDWSAFEAFGDTSNGEVWFNYIAKHEWPHSCYDTRTYALRGSDEAMKHMTNYYVALVAANLKGK